MGRGEGEISVSIMLSDHISGALLSSGRGQDHQVHNLSPLRWFSVGSERDELARSDPLN